MVDVPLTYTSDERDYATLPSQLLENRYFEANPTQGKGAVLLARPGSGVLDQRGDGPIRGFYSLPGLFNGALFFVSDSTLYRREADGTTITIAGDVYATDDVSMTGVSGAGYERLFIADGQRLQYYAGGSQAQGVLTVTALPSEGDTIRVGATYYEWTATVAAGAGTVGDPWKVLLGETVQTATDNMVAALTFTGTTGTTYSANLGGRNTDVDTTGSVDTTGVGTITVTAVDDLETGADIALGVTSVNTVPSSSWGGATLSGGGVHALSGVSVPDGQTPAGLATLKSYVLVTIGGSGRFYWLAPGEVVIDPLDFATAESQPDNVLNVIVAGDQAWFIGEGSTEIWYPTGDLAAPFRPVSGRVYDRGAVEGTAVNVKGGIILLGADWTVYAIAGTAQRISNHGVEQLIREALGN